MCRSERVASGERRGERRAAGHAKGCGEDSSTVGEESSAHFVDAATGKLTELGNVQIQ